MLDSGRINFRRTHKIRFSCPRSISDVEEPLQLVYGKRSNRAMSNWTEFRDKPIVNSSKSMFGHLIGAGGAIELTACLTALNEKTLPPTINLHHPDPNCDLDYVPNKARRADVRIALSNSFAFGGQNASIIVKQYE